MLQQFYLLLSACICLLLSWSLANAYDYPFADRYAATVIGTPAEFAAVVPKDIPTKVDTINFPEEK